MMNANILKELDEPQDQRHNMEIVTPKQTQSDHLGLATMLNFCFPYSLLGGGWDCMVASIPWKKNILHTFFEQHKLSELCNMLSTGRWQVELVLCFRTTRWLV